ncbi:MAG: hypothetical protein IPM15_03705 [Betaproteobacteria bacterium]|nr:hypothetical protein [Betaproteobacteria bacterium]
MSMRTAGRRAAVVLAASAAAWVMLAAPAHAQGTEASASTPAKKELVARVLKLQQPGLENIGRQLVEQPWLQMANAVRAEIGRLPQDKREAVAREIEADVRRYAEDAVPVVRDRAVALAPTTIGPLLEQRFTEDELRQLITILESPINARYQALGQEMQRALITKVVAETRAAVEPKVKALEQSVQTRLRAAGGGGGGASGPAAGPRRPASGAGN